MILSAKYMDGWKEGRKEGWMDGWMNIRLDEEALYTRG
jgi:hypothetical protein